jgi:predicted ArsR family transcriptional regulator
MIEIATGTLEDRVIKLLRKVYPITVTEIKNKLNLSTEVTLRTLKKLQLKGIVKLEPLPGKTYVKLLRNDFSFVGRRQQKKFIKHHREKIKITDDYDGMMYG